MTKAQLHKQLIELRRFSHALDRALVEGNDKNAQLWADALVEAAKTVQAAVPKE